MTTHKNQQQPTLLRQKVFQLSHQLQLTRIQNDNLINEVAQLKQKQQKLKQINNMLINNLKNSQQQINDQITLNINGQFLTNRIHQLQEQLQKYKSGVSESVDRRVKKIVNQYTQEKDLQYEKRKSRLSLGNKQGDNARKYYETHQHKYYNIEYKTYAQTGSKKVSQEKQLQKTDRRSNFGNILQQQSICQQYLPTHNGNKCNNDTKTICENCFELQQMLEQKEGLIHKLNQKIRHLGDLCNNSSNLIEEKSLRMNSSSQEWKLKYLQVLKLYQNLRQQHEMLVDECSNFSQCQQQQHQEQSYTITQSPINGFKKKQIFPPNINTLPNANPCQSRLFNQPKDREQQMLQEITNLVNGLGRNKKVQHKDKENYQPQHHKQQQVFAQDKKSRVSYAGGSSRISQQSKLDNSQFTIKEGVNRYGQSNGLF